MEVIQTDLYLFSPYYLAFCKQLPLRDSCYSCKFATHNRVSDLTIADFHTIHKYDSTVDRFAGVSMVITNTDKGEGLLTDCSNDLVMKEMDIQTLIDNNECLKHPTERPNSRDSFLDSLENEEFAITVSKYLSWQKEWKRLIYYKSPPIIRNIAQKIVSRI